MGRPKETFNKKQQEIKRLQKRQQKESKKIERLNNRQKGAPLTDMMAYVDEDGNLSSTPPGQGMLKQVGKPERRNNEQSAQGNNSVRTGIVTFFNEAKGFGFIQDQQTKDRVFMHASDLIDKVQEQSMVNFEVELGTRGLSARKVRLVLN